MYRVFMSLAVIVFSIEIIYADDLPGHASNTLSAEIPYRLDDMEKVVSIPRQSRGLYVREPLKAAR